MLVGPELVQVFPVAGLAVCHVTPFRVILNRVVELRSPAGQFDHAIPPGTSLSVRVGVSLQDAVLNVVLKAAPLLVRRFALHPPEYYRGVTTCTPVLMAQALAAFLIQR
jgi:hypothetical protein